MGVVAEVKQRDLSTPTFPATYVPFNQWALGFFSVMVFGIGVLDPVTLAFAPLVLLVAALLGCYIPARRAARVDPIVSMRSD